MQRLLAGRFSRLYSGLYSGGLHSYSSRFYSSDAAKDFIKRTLAENDVVIFMKGTISSPMVPSLKLFNVVRV
jgi:hypothetical protein